VLPDDIVLGEAKILRLVDDDEEDQANFELSNLVTWRELDILVHLCKDFSQRLLEDNAKELVVEKPTWISCLLVNAIGQLDHMPHDTQILRPDARFLIPVCGITQLSNGSEHGRFFDLLDGKRSQSPVLKIWSVLDGSVKASQVSCHCKRSKLSVLESIRPLQPRTLLP
jgi:hypothetical protein